MHYCFLLTFFSIDAVRQKNNMAICCYCKKETKLSREHIYSDSILQLFANVAPLTIDTIREVVHKGDPIVKDICAKCNSKLSIYDSEALDFSNKYLTQPIEERTVIKCNSSLLKKWALKTAFNNLRSIKYPNTWWESFLPHLLDGKDNELYTIHFAAWEDMSPYKFAELTSSVYVIDFKEALFKDFIFCENIDIKKVTKFNCALKIGYGVFLLSFWNEEYINTIPDIISYEIGQYGWQLLSDKLFIIQKPFNKYTSTIFYIITPTEYGMNNVSRLK